MSEIDVALLTTTLVAIGIGIVFSKSWPLKLSICVNVALIAWLCRGIAILNGDQTTAGDYLNGLSYLSAAVEIITAVAWVALWSWFGTILRRLYRRLRPSVLQPAG